MKKQRKIIEIDEERCDGCGNCIPACAEGALQIVDGKAKLVKDIYCDGLGACLGECPQDALHLIEREAEEFDPEAVEEYLKEQEKEHQAEPAGAGCPSARMETFDAPCRSANEPSVQAGADSALTHWPVQIRLVPPHAPFLKGAHLLVAADCAPVACANFHRDFLQGRVVLIGCPKFDNPQEYVDKFAEIFRQADVNSVMVLDMEVPCCSALPGIVRKGMSQAGKSVPLEEVTLSARGEIVERKKHAA